MLHKFVIIVARLCPSYKDTSIALLYGEIIGDNCEAYLTKAADVAQLVEQQYRKLRVAGSNPAIGS